MSTHRLTAFSYAAIALLAASLAACGPVQPQPDNLTAPHDKLRAQLAETPTELGGNAIPTELSLQLTVDPDLDRYQGNAAWTVQVLPHTTAFRIHACQAIELGPVALFPLPEHSPQAENSIPAAVTRDGCIATIRPDVPLTAGLWTVVIPFSRPWSTARVGGFYRFEDRGQSFVASQLGSRSARQALPVFDEPLFKPRVRLEVLAPVGNIVATNGALHRVEPAENGLQRYVFAQTPPMPTYVLALAAGPFLLHESPHARLLSTRPISDPAYVLSRVGPLIESLQNLTGSEQPYRKPDLVALGQLAPEAMENPGVITFRHNVLDVGPDSPFERRQYLAWVIAHELAHMWIGNMVTMRWWDDIWINESLATWLATRATVVAFPELHADVFELEKRRQMMRARIGDAPSILRSIRSDTANSEIFVTQVYYEGAAIVDWLALATGAEVFLGRLHEVLAQRRFATVNRAELLAGLLGDGATIAEQLLAIDGLPHLSLRWSCADGLLEAHTQLRTQAWVPEPPEDSPLSIPVCLSLEGKSEPLCQSVANGSRFEHALERCPAWLHPNAGEHGYYTWSLERDSLSSLVDHAGLLSTREQGMLPFHLGQMVLSGELQAAHGFKLLARASARVGPQAAFAAGLMETIAEFEAMPTLGEHPLFREWASELLGHVGPLREPWNESLLAEQQGLDRIRLAPEPPIELLPEELVDPAINTNPETFAMLMEVAPWSGPELIDVALAGYGADGICNHPEVGRALGLTRDEAAISALRVMQSCPYGVGVQTYIETVESNPAGARPIFQSLASKTTDLTGSDRYFLALSGMAYCHPADERDLLRGVLLDLGWDTASIGAELNFQERCWHANQALEPQVDDAFQHWAPGPAVHRQDSDASRTGSKDVHSAPVERDSVQVVRRHRQHGHRRGRHSTAAAAL